MSIALDKKNPLDLTARIQTPENIEFEYRIAGPFRRFPALVLDFVMRMLILVGAYIFFLIVVSALAITAKQTFLADFGMLIIVVFDFLLLWFYGAFFETYWNGQTPGKWACKIRVISVDGRPVNTFQAVVRNLVRPADFAPMLSIEIFSPELPPAYIIPTFLVSFLCMLLTKRFQRLGDLAAGTMVVVNERSWVPSNVKLEDPRTASLSEYIPPNFRLTPTLAKAVALYAERRSRIPVGRRMELANILAAPLMKSFGFREDTSPDLLLCAIYYREFVCKNAFSSNSSGGQRSLSDVSPIASSAPSADIALTSVVPSLQRELGGKHPNLMDQPISVQPPSLCPPPIIEMPESGLGSAGDEWRPSYQPRVEQE